LMKKSPNQPARGRRGGIEAMKAIPKAIIMNQSHPPATGWLMYCVTGSMNCLKSIFTTH